MSSSNILITGGTGLLGNHLKKLFAEKNYHVNILSRNPGNTENVFLWNVEDKFIDTEVFKEAETIIHLAGTSIAEKRWTAKRKKEIIESRTTSTELLYEKLKTTPHRVKTFISASAIGIYGDMNDKWANEDQLPGTDFSANVCKQWEASVNRISELGIRVVILRIGIVLAKDGGALPQLALPVKLFVGSALGSGKQYVSWIHIDDLCNVFLKAMNDEKINGVYNAVAPDPVSNKAFTKALAKILHRPMWPVRVPSFILRMLLGEKAAIILTSQRVSSKKIISAGFNFQFKNLEDALENIYLKPLTADS